jgi:DNA polymerase-3 subunit gamma/tau
MGLYQKHRPDSFSKVIGNDITINALEKMVENKGTCPHTFMFAGETGCGKTTLANILAAEVGAIGIDLEIINFSNLRGIDTVRDIIQKSSYSPIEGTGRVWIIEESQKMTSDAQNAFLPLLENPPRHVYFILCTTEPFRLIEPIRNRCMTFTVEKLNEIQMMKLLKSILHKEHETIDQNVLEQIIESAEGKPRQAIQTLEKVMSLPEEKRLKAAKSTGNDKVQAIELCKALLKNAGWKELTLILKGIEDEDPEGIRRLVLKYFQTVLLKEDNERVAAIIETFSDNFYSSGFTGLVLACYTVFKG